MGNTANLVQAALGTKHGKESVIGEVLLQIGFTVFVPPGFPSDSFGTFTGEIERPGNQLETAILKARKAAEITGMSIALASEGSYGPHPIVPIAAVGRELVVLLDLEKNLCIEGWWAGTKTNFLTRWVSSMEDARKFAMKIGFPEHGIVVQSSPHRHADQMKGIHDWDVLEHAVAKHLRNGDKPFLQSDMRAFHNPTRLESIRLAAVDLVEAYKTCCPDCRTPGYRVRGVERGLPCESCGLPTENVKADRLACQACNREELRPRPGRTTAESTYCQFCNP